MGKNFIYSKELMRSHNNIYAENISVDCTPAMESLPYMLLIYVAHHNGALRIYDALLNLREGDIYLVKANTPQTFYSTDKDYGMAVYCCAFDEGALPFKFEKLESEFPNLSSFLKGNQPFLCVRDTPVKDIRNIFVSMLDEYASDQPCDEYSIQSYLTLMVIKTMKIAAAVKGEKTKLNGNIIVGQVINYINYNIHKKITLKELADLQHITPEYLCRLFRKETGKKLKDFINTVRVEQIKDALEHTDRPLYLIYEDYEYTKKYIDTLFRKHTGCSMNQYKSKYNYKVNNPLYKKSFK